MARVFDRVATFLLKFRASAAGSSGINEWGCIDFESFTGFNPLRWQLIRGPQRVTEPYTVIRRFLLDLNSSVRYHWIEIIKK